MRSVLILSVWVSLLISPIPSILILPQVVPLWFSTPYAGQQFYTNSLVDLYPRAGPVFSPVRSANVSIPSLPPQTSTRLAARTLDLCYFLGKDIFKSHLTCNQNWADGTTDGVKKYINEFTFETNRVIGLNNLRLAWKGPYSRHDADKRYPSNPSLDTLAVSKEGCDAVVFIVFNEFTQDCKTGTQGHKYGGFSQGGMCESGQGSGYTVVVDQGFMDNVWSGPQILAHHLVKMLITDITGEKTCPNKTSLLHPQLYPGEQHVDQCAVDKLNLSSVSSRPCMQN